MYLGWRSVINMISRAFRKTIAEELKLNYDIELCRLKKLSSKGYLYQDFNLYCKSAGFSNLLRLRINFCNDDDEDYRRSFNIFSDNTGLLSSCKKFQEKICTDIIRKAIFEVKNLFSFLDSRYTYTLSHETISLFSGTYLKRDNELHINTLHSFVETTSKISVYMSYSDYPICSVNIIGDCILVRPVNDHMDEHFKELITMDEENIDVFKASFSKCLLLHINKKSFSSATYNHNPDDYMNLTYDELKKYFLVLEMEKI